MRVGVRPGLLVRLAIGVLLTIGAAACSGSMSADDFSSDGHYQGVALVCSADACRPLHYPARRRPMVQVVLRSASGDLSSAASVDPKTGEFVFALQPEGDYLAALQPTTFRGLHTTTVRVHIVKQHGTTFTVAYGSPGSAPHHQVR